jgi:uncharacterized secreted protein with C-terminal beta-propeller domain
MAISCASAPPQGIAPGEDIRAVRFDGDRGYIVTFKKTDPLFVLDLYQPRIPGDPGRAEDPRLLDLHAPHRPDHLLSIGFDAERQRATSRTSMESFCSSST